MSITLTPVDYAALSPLLIVLVGSLLVLLLESFTEHASKRYSSLFTLAVFAIALYATIDAPVSTNALLTPWLSFDPMARIFTIFFLCIGLASTLLAWAFFQRVEVTRGEYYFFLLASVFGLILIGESANFLTLFLGVETLSIPLYVLCCYIKQWKVSHEAAVKYFLLGGLSSAFLLYGIALIYGATGTTDFDALLSGYQAIATSANHNLFFAGIALVTLGLGFKAAIVPFHVWAPDVYDGAPTPVTAYMAVGVKVGAFAAFARVFFNALPNFADIWKEGIVVLAFATLLYANYVALRQTRLRRFFAYSGISHAGFLLILVAVGTPEALSAMLFYLAIYVLATLGCFAVMAFLDERSDGVAFADLHGLSRRAPVLAGVLSLCLLTLAGIPPTVGFLAKFYLFKVAFQAGYYILVIVALLTTILSAYYYLRIVGLMFSESPLVVAPPKRAWPAAVVGVVVFAGIILLSIYPAPLMSYLSSFMPIAA